MIRERRYRDVRERIEERKEKSKQQGISKRRKKMYIAKEWKEQTEEIEKSKEQKVSQYLNRKRTKGKASEANKTELTKIMDLFHILLQWNVQGINSSKEDLVKLVDDLKPSILAIQETFQANSSVTNLIGYNWVATEGHYRHRYHGGVTLYIHNTLPYEEIVLNTRLQISVAKVNVGHRKPITFASLYMSGNIQVQREEMETFLEQLEEPVMLMGDFNAHHEMWGNNRADRREKLIEEIAREMDFNILNDGTPTYISGTAVDLTVVSPELSPEMRWMAISTVLNSDHFPLLTTIKAASSNFDHNYEILNFKKCNWSQFKDDVYWNGMGEVPEGAKNGVGRLYEHLKLN